MIRNNVDDTTTLRFTYNDAYESKYKIMQSVNIKYNYSNISNSEFVTYKLSEEDIIRVDFSNAFFQSEDVTTELQRITLNNINIVDNDFGKAANNYQLANYGITGRILKRTIIPHLECLNKVYDGSNLAPFKVSNKFYQGLENSISGDDIYIDTTFEGNKDDNFHLVTKVGSSVLTFNDENVGITDGWEDLMSDSYSIFLTDLSKGDAVAEQVKQIQSIRDNGKVESGRQ